MGKDLLDIPEVQEMYSTASDILGFDLLEMSLHGPEDVLSRTQVQQPAILVASLATVERWVKAGLQDQRRCCILSL